MKSRFYAIFGILISLTIIFFVLGPSQGHIAQYFLTDEQFQDMVLGDNSHVNDSRNTKNPNECRYDDGDGNMLPCEIGTAPILWDPSYPAELDCDEICVDNETKSNFDNKTVRVEGNMADEICATIGGECPPHYPGNLQDDGSIMVGFVISDQEKIKHYQFFIKNNTLSYDVMINEK